MHDDARAWRGRRVLVTEATRLFGWRPQVSLDEGLVRTIAWAWERKGQ